VVGCGPLSLLRTRVYAGISRSREIDHDSQQDHNRNHSDRDGRLGRDKNEIREWAREHDLPYCDGQVHFPDYRIEHEVGH
jgi:hypothetical protein